MEEKKHLIELGKLVKEIQKHNAEMYEALDKLNEKLNSDIKLTLEQVLSIGNKEES